MNSRRKQILRGVLVALAVVLAIAGAIALSKCPDEPVPAGQPAPGAAPVEAPAGSSGPEMDATAGEPSSGG